MDCPNYAVQIEPEVIKCMNQAEYEVYIAEQNKPMGYVPFIAPIATVLFVILVVAVAVEMAGRVKR